MAKRVIFTDRVMRPIAHFSHAVRVGDTVHLGATAGTDAERRLAGVTPGLVDADAQIARMFDNALTVLGLLQAGPADVVRVKTYLTDLRDQPRYDAHFRRVFGAIRPHHVVVGSAGFPLPQAAVELDLVAQTGGDIRRWPDADGGGRSDAVSAAGRHYCLAAPVAAGAATVAAGGFDAQCAVVFARLREQLAVAGLTTAQTVYLHVTLAETALCARFRRAFDALFGERPPACALVVAAPQSVDWLLQVEAISVPGGGRPVALPIPLPDAGLPGSPAVLAGDDLYIGAQPGLLADGSLADGVEAQTRAAWERIRLLLAAAGMGPEDILRTNNVLVDWRHYAGFNAGYGAHVTEPYPPRATVLGALPVPGACVQIEAIAHRAGRDAVIVQAG